MSKKLGYISLLTLIAVNNVREVYEGLEALRDDIEERGLDTPLEIWRHDDGKGSMMDELLRGFRRAKALALLQEKIGLEKFDAKFPNGIPAYVHTNITREDAILIKLDHNGVRGLKLYVEVQNCATQLFDANRTEEQVVKLLGDLMDLICPMKGEVKTEVEALREKGLNSDADEREFKYRRGLVQGMHDNARLPLRCHHALVLNETGKLPADADLSIKYPKAGFNKDALKKLYKAFVDDQKILGVDKIPCYSRQRPGPKFLKTWDELLAAAAKKLEEKEAGTAEPRAKAMSAKEMKAEISNGVYSSHLAKAVTMRHAGEDVGGIKELDQACYMAELVKNGDGVLWSMVVESAQKLQAAQAEADAASAAEVSDAEAATTGQPMANAEARAQAVA